MEIMVTQKQSNDNKYGWLYRHCMKYVVGTTKWNKNLETGNMMVMEVAMESDETMLLLILLKYWNLWTKKAAAKDKTMVPLHNINRNFFAINFFSMVL
jgi:hypothetical protein